MNKIRKLLNIDYYHKLGITGKNVGVAILDSGAYLHPDYADRILFFKDFINDYKKPYDDNSHGSHVSGIIAGFGKLNRLYKGIAPFCNIIPIKVLDKSGHGSSEIIVDANNWILENMDKYNIRIVNISIGTKASSCSEENSLLVKSVDALWDAGIIVLVSAGNNGPDYQSITIPGISRKVITVGSCKWGNAGVGDYHYKFSGKGPTFCNVPKPDIVVPGDNIISCSNTGWYDKKSGTSMSTPVVSGVAALLLSQYPGIKNTVFKDLLKKTAYDLGLDKFTQGSGRLDTISLFRALAELV